MTEGLVVVLCVGIGVLGVLGVLAVSAVENVWIAKHTGVDPRADRQARRDARRRVRAGGGEGQG